MLMGGRCFCLLKTYDLDPHIHTDPEFKNKIAPGYWLSNDPDHLKYIKVVEARCAHRQPLELLSHNEHFKVQ